MKSFYQFMETMANSNGPSLPPIPAGMGRLTHFTAADPREIGASGLKIATMLFSTSDPHSTNEQVVKTITDGAVGAMNRSHFGPFVVLMDIPEEYIRILIAATNQIDLIPATQVVGHVDRNDMSFHANPKYAPNKMERPRIAPDRNIGSGEDDTGYSGVGIPAPGPRDANEPAVW